MPSESRSIAGWICRRYIRDRHNWVPVAPGVTGFAVPGAESPHSTMTVTIYRKKVHHRATEN